MYLFCQEIPSLPNFFYLRKPEKRTRHGRLDLILDNEMLRTYFLILNILTFLIKYKIFMKKIFYIFLAIIYYSNSFGQITIDSMLVYQTPGTDSLASRVDSIYISGTSEGQVLKNTQIASSLLDDSVIILLSFEGCDSINPTFYDTKIVYGYYIPKIIVFSEWDTTANCSYPIVPFYTDTLFWYDSPVNTEQLINEKQVKVYPNPAQDILKIEITQGIRPRKIQLISLSGAVVKSFEPDERLLDIQSIPSGFYFLKIEMEEGYILTKKVIVE
jgi:hypothetical protein